MSVKGGFSEKVTPEQKPEGVKVGSCSQAVLPGGSAQDFSGSPTNTQEVCLRLREESPQVPRQLLESESGTVSTSASSKGDTNRGIS